MNSATSHKSVTDYLVILSSGKILQLSESLIKSIFNMLFFNKEKCKVNHRILQWDDMKISFPTLLNYMWKTWILEISWLSQVHGVIIGRQRLNPRFHNSCQYFPNNYRITSNPHLKLLTKILKCSLFLSTFSEWVYEPCINLH